MIRIEIKPDWNRKLPATRGADLAPFCRFPGSCRAWDRRGRCWTRQCRGYVRSYRAGSSTGRCSGDRPVMASHNQVKVTYSHMRRCNLQMGFCIRSDKGVPGAGRRFWWTAWCLCRVCRASRRCRCRSCWGRRDSWFCWAQFRWWWRGSILRPVVHV